MDDMDKVFAVSGILMVCIFCMVKLSGDIHPRGNYISSEPSTRALVPSRKFPKQPGFWEVECASLKGFWASAFILVIKYWHKRIFVKSAFRNTQVIIFKFTIHKQFTQQTSRITTFA